MGADHPGRNPRHTYRAVTNGVGAVFDLVNSVAGLRLAHHPEHVGGSGPGGSVAVIDGDAAPLRSHMDEHLTVTCHGGVPRLNHVEAKTRGNGGVHGVSTALENVDSNLGGDRVRGGNRTVFDDNLVLVRTPDAACVQCPEPPVNKWATLVGRVRLNCELFARRSHCKELEARPFRSRPNGLSPLLCPAARTYGAVGKAGGGLGESPCTHLPSLPSSPDTERSFWLYFP